MKLPPNLQQYFDGLVEEALEVLPDDVRATLEEVPLLVEDFPSRAILRSVGVDDPDELQGLYTHIPPTIHLFRRGLLLLATDDDGEIDDDELFEQIRVTILHEVAHHRGMNEGEVDELGYG
jgi:predicted Zn-dependent protease with MMP-like domain